MKLLSSSESSWCGGESEESGVKVRTFKQTSCLVRLVKIGVDTCKLVGLLLVWLQLNKFNVLQKPKCWERYWQKRRYQFHFQFPDWLLLTVELPTSFPKFERSQCLLGSKQNHLGTVSRKRVRRGRKFPSRFAREGRGGCQGGGRAWGWQPLFFLEIKNFFIKISPTLTMMVSLWRRRSKGVLARPLRHVARLVLVSNLRHSDRGQGEVM